MGQRAGTFVISLDFELFWGMRDHRDLNGYGERILGVREAIPRMLEAFDAHGVKATFATVGLLFFRDKAGMLAGLPKVLPSYHKAALSPFNGHLATVGNDEQADPYHFGASLLDRIAAHPGHELGCHTFSHYYCLEQGQTREQFRADLEACQQAASGRGALLRSFVFPRNQYNAEYLASCAEAGITAYRGNENSWLYRARNREQESVLRRSLRLLDTWLDLSGPNTHPHPRREEALPLNIPASRFLRPYAPRYRALEGMRARRITRAMDHAARHGELFHLWWHPHNFGKHTDANIAFLQRILAHYSMLQRQHGFRSMTMGELAHETLAHA